MTQTEPETTIHYAPGVKPGPTPHGYGYHVTRTEFYLTGRGTIRVLSRQRVGWVVNTGTSDRPCWVVFDTAGNVRVSASYKNSGTRRAALERAAQVMERP